MCGWLCYVAPLALCMYGLWAFDYLEQGWWIAPAGDRWQCCAGEDTRESGNTEG